MKTSHPILQKIFFTFLIAMGLSSFLHGASTDVIQKTFEVEDGASLHVDVERTDVSITVWDKPGVEIVLTRNVEAGSDEAEAKILAADSITVAQDGNKIVVKVETKDRKGGPRAALDYSLVARVPAPLAADIKASAAPVYVRGLAADVKIKSSAGEVSLRDLTGDLNAEVSGSGITSRDTKGKASYRTSGGGIRVDRHDGRLELHTSGGGLILEDVKGSVKARTTGGSIDASFVSAPDKASELYATGGSLKITLPSDVSTTIEASAIGGKIESDFALEEGSKGGIRATQRGKINNGGPTLTLRSTGGSVTIKSEE